MSDLSRKEIFEALECCLTQPFVNCADCPLQHVGYHACKQELAIQTAQSITILEDKNKSQKKRLENQKNEILRLQSYEHLVNDIIDDLSDYFTKALIKIFTPSKEGETE